MQAFGIIGGVKFGGFGATWLELRNRTFDTNKARRGVPHDP